MFGFRKRRRGYLVSYINTSGALIERWYASGIDATREANKIKAMLRASQRHSYVSLVQVIPVAK